MRTPANELSLTSSSLLDRIRSQAPEAWSRLVALYAPLIYDICRRHRIQPNDADDIAQEVLRAVVRRVGEFKKERTGDSFRGWLYRIVQNKIRDHLRRQANRQAVGGTEFRAAVEQMPEEISLDETILPGESAPGAGKADPAVARALELIRSEFQERTWTAFWRLTVDGHRAADIAADLGMKPNAVRQAKCRVLQRLRLEFGDLLDLPD